MTSAEHSTLVFLCQAIEVSPDKVADLCSLALGSIKRSDEFLKVVQDLKNTAADPEVAVETAQKTRLMLRKS